MNRNQIYKLSLWAKIVFVIEFNLITHRVQNLYVSYYECIIYFVKTKKKNSRAIKKSVKLKVYKFFKFNGGCQGLQSNT